MNAYLSLILQALMEKLDNVVTARMWVLLIVVVVHWLLLLCSYCLSGWSRFEEMVIEAWGREGEGGRNTRSLLGEQQVSRCKIHAQIHKHLRLYTHAYTYVHIYVHWYMHTCTHTPGRWLFLNTCTWRWSRPAQWWRQLAPRMPWCRLRCACCRAMRPRNLYRFRTCVNLLWYIYICIHTYIHTYPKACGLGHASCRWMRLGNSVKSLCSLFTGITHTHEYVFRGGTPHASFVYCHQLVYIFLSPWKLPDMLGNVILYVVCVCVCVYVYV